MRYTKALSVLFFTLLPCYSQNWSGIVAPSRAIDWSSAGLLATLPTGEVTTNPWTPPVRSKCGSTISAGASAATINSALGACSAGTYVLLGAGSFTINNANITLYNQNGVTLRGSGAQSTTLHLTGSSQILFGIAWNQGTCTWLTGLSAGSTSLTMNGCSGPALVPGEMITFSQCDTGYSGTPCSGTSADNGGLYICGDNNACQVDSNTGNNNHQSQVVYVSSVSGSSTFTVNFTPGIYMPNWATARTALVTWEATTSAGNTANPYGNALEDLTVYTTSSSADYSVVMNFTYSSWIKGVRFLGSATSEPLDLTHAKSCLISNNYFFSDIGIDSLYPAGMAMDTSSDNLILNNIMASGVPWEGLGGNEGNVLAYNYGRDTFTTYYENNLFDHHAGTAFGLFEGNQVGIWTGDNTWGTHDLDTLFRNYFSGWDPPYQTMNPRAVQIDAYARFMSVVGNSIGSALITNYASSTAFAFGIDILGATDTLVGASLLRWGNCDTATATCRFQSGEVPTSLSGNAAPFVNSIPASNNLPCSFYMNAYTASPCTLHPNGGTGLSWWKVCTAWTSFPTSCSTSQTQSFPISGPDISGAPYVNGHAYDIPAAIAFANLPIDTSFQSSYTITSSSWSSGTETLTISGLPDITHLMGPFQISGGACSTGTGEAYITGSTTTTVSYALTGNPGACAGTFKFPDVRQFDELVYQSDPASSSGGSVSTGSQTRSGAGVRH